MALNILVVDDSAVMRRMILRTLQLTGIPVGEVHEAGNGAEALAILAEHWVDLAMVDINMPVMNGLELLERVRADEDTADLSVVVVSTEGSDVRLARVRELGADFVRKPFTPEQLREVVVRTTGAFA